MKKEVIEMFEKQYCREIEMGRGFAGDREVGKLSRVFLHNM